MGEKDQVTLQNSCLPCLFFFFRRMRLGTFREVVFVPFCRRHGIIKLTERKRCINFVPDGELLKTAETGSESPQETLRRLIEIRKRTAVYE